MKKSIQGILKLAVVAILITVLMVSCRDADNASEPSLTGQSKTYILNSVSNPVISGAVKFAERRDNTTIVTIELNGTSSGNTPVASIRENSAAETGGVLIDLNLIKWFKR